MENKNLYFDQAQDRMGGVGKAEKTEVDEEKPTEEEKHADKNENRNNSISKEMVEFAKSPKLEEALRAYYDAKIKGRRKRNQYVEEIPFKMHIHNSDFDGHEKENKPFRKMDIIVEYWRYTEYGYNEDYGKEKRDNISFEIAYDEKNGLTFNGKNSFDEAIKSLAELTALKIIDNEKWEEEKKEERERTRPVRSKLYEQNLLKRNEEKGWFGKIKKRIGIGRNNKLTKQQLESLANFE